jgi:tetratricopeptide (TPR) repeat protein
MSERSEDGDERAQRGNQWAQRGWSLVAARSEARTAMSEPIQPEYDPDTLHEVYPEEQVARERVAELRAEVRTAPDETAELLARGDLVDLLRGLGELDEALDEARRAVDRAELAGTPAQQHLARVRLAQVQQRRGGYVDSNIAFTELVHAAAGFGPVIEAYTHQNAGSNSYDQRDYAAARDHFARALGLREEFELPDEEIAVSRQALQAAERRLEEAQ